jgi:hypothetical protein
MQEELDRSPARRSAAFRTWGAIVPGADADLVVLVPRSSSRPVRPSFADAHDPWTARTTTLALRHVLLRGEVVVRLGGLASPSMANGRALTARIRTPTSIANCRFQRFGSIPSCRTYTGRMRATLQPTAEEQRQFLLRLYFLIQPWDQQRGDPKDDWLQGCVDRAYLDFCRTLPGVAKHTTLRRGAAEVPLKALQALRTSPCPSQDAFDKWHGIACETLRSCYRQSGYTGFTFGHAQKWLNMAFKYVHVVGPDLLPGFDPYYSFGHIPIDNIVMDAFHRELGIRRINSAWSKLDDYGTYLDFQQSVRASIKLSGRWSSPLAAEFWLFQGRQPEDLAEHDSEVH